MMHVSPLSYASLGLLGLFALEASALACEPQFLQSAQTIMATASEVGNQDVIETEAQILVRNGGQDECAAFLRFSRFSTSAPDPSRIITLSTSGQTIDVLPSELSAASLASDIFIAAIPGGGTSSRPIPLRMTFPTDWGISSGTSSETFLVQLIDETGAAFDDLVLTVNLNVLPSVKLRIVGATGNDRIARIDLGPLDPRQVTRSNPFGVRVWSTSPYSVTFASENVGMLAHVNAGDRIGYEMRAAGREVDLSGASPGAFGRKTDAVGDYHPLEIAVPPFVAQAGDYRDRVVITVTAG
ncbi:hypothetical protein J3454_15560 [Erythrobacter sp. NFXS35]|uniref:hypothetical protein n=1 Tax=Erythrobacter sp. NFXS35 TaxID=2818436 RepID=UPI0032E046CC